MRIQVPTAVLLGAALLTGCGSVDTTSPGADTGARSGTSDSSTSQEAPSVGGAGDYDFAYAGATGTISVPTDPTDPRLDDIEAYREGAGAAGITYFVADIDNTAGTENINMYQVVVVTDTGQQVEAAGVGDLISFWQNGPNDYNTGVDLINNNSVFLRPGSVGTAVMAAPVELDGEPARVYVMPAGGIDEVEATKVE